jgi:hypothetical protein
MGRAGAGVHGSLSDVGTLPKDLDVNASAPSLAIAPSGNCWLLAISALGAFDTGTTLTRVYGGAIGSAGELLETIPSPGGSGLALLRWDPLGALLDTWYEGGAPPDFTGVLAFDPTTGVLASLCGGGGFGDRAPDGTLACLAGGNGGSEDLDITPPHGTGTVIATGAPFADQVAFVGGSSLLTFCSDATPAQQGQSPGPDTLKVVPVTEGATPTSLQTGDWADHESGWAFDKVVGSGEILELRFTPDKTAADVVLVNVHSGATTTIAHNAGLYGAISAA